MEFFKVNQLRKALLPLYGRSTAEKIKFLWKLGWKTNPVMTTCTIGSPFILLYTIYFMVTQDREDLVRKYNKHITIYRSDDPRIKKIRYDSIIDH